MANINDNINDNIIGEQTEILCDICENKCLKENSLSDQDIANASWSLATLGIKSIVLGANNASDNARIFCSAKCYINDKNKLISNAQKTKFVADLKSHFLQKY